MNTAGLVLAPLLGAIILWCIVTLVKNIDKFNSIRECERFLNYGRGTLDSYIDSEKPRGNLVFYTRNLSKEDIEKASWHLDAFVTLKDKL